MMAREEHWLRDRIIVDWARSFDSPLVGPVLVPSRAVGARIQIDWDSLAGLDSANLGEFLTRYDPVREGLFPPAGDVGRHDQTWANTARELVTPRHANLGDGSIIFDEGMAVTGTPEFVELPDDPVFVELPDDAIVLRRVVDDDGHFALAGVDVELGAYWSGRTVWVFASEDGTVVTENPEDPQDPDGVQLGRDITDPVRPRQGSPVPALLPEPQTASKMPNRTPTRWCSGLRPMSWV